jgi:predicted Mrr-cat superfamily restriction endonuclease
MKFWQIMAGDGVVDLESIFKKLNVALIGPGDLGDYFDHRDAYMQRTEDRDHQLVRVFCEDVAVGDAMILIRAVNPRGSEWAIEAVGTVAGAYRYEPIFESADVSRWDMQHCRRVKWVIPPEPIRVVGGGFPIRIQRCSDDNPLVAKAREFLAGRQ